MITLHVGISRHHEVVQAGDAAFGAWMRLLDWATEFDTEGFVPGVVAASTAKRTLIAKMVKAQLLVEQEDGYVIPDHLRPANTNASDVAGFIPAKNARPLTNAERQAKLRARRNESNVSRNEEVTPSNAEVTEPVTKSNDESNAAVTPSRALTLSSLDLKSSLSPVNLKQDPEREWEGGVGETQTRDTPSGVFEIIREPKTKKNRSTSCPTSNATEIELEAWVTKWNIDSSHAEFNRFLDYNRSKGNQYVDWTATWRNWLSRAAQYSAQRPKDILQQPATSGWTWKTGEVIR